jgi:ATP-dependent DNA helicase RecG
MALPLNITELIHGRVVEWDRLEFKAGWNPDAIARTLCAFANDVDNWGGGYIVVGFEANEGVPIFPPQGLALDAIDKIQGKLIELSNSLQPSFHPISQPYVIEGRHILVIWAPAGEFRPYSCPSHHGANAKRQFYIRQGSVTKVAQGADLQRLMQLTSRIPFDDRVNELARIEDLDLGLIREFLQRVRSELFDAAARIPFDELCRQMQIARGPTEFLRPINVGLLFFNREPHKFFQRAWIELAVHEDDFGRNFVSKRFDGPIHRQVEDCLAYFRANILRSHTEKLPQQAAAVVYENWPYAALEEAIVNAVYHKAYDDGKPIEIQVFPDRIEVLSYPGPLPPITNQVLHQGRVLARDYRNRRIGDFLRELRLTEGKATGMPLIRNVMSRNSSPVPTFFTDDERTVFLVTLPCNERLLFTRSKAPLTFEHLIEVLSMLASKEELSRLLASLASGESVDFFLEANQLTANAKGEWGTGIGKILNLLGRGEMGRNELLETLGLTNETRNYEAHIKPLLEINWVEMTLPDRPKSRFQKYRLTSDFMETYSGIHWIDQSRAAKRKG